MRERLSRRTPEQTLDALEENALRAVRALGVELGRQAATEDAAGRLYGGNSAVRRDRILGDLFAALTWEETGRPLAVSVGDVQLTARAEAEVDAFLESQGLTEDERALLVVFERDGLQEDDRASRELRLLASVIAEVPGALWSPRVRWALDGLGSPSPEGPAIEVLERESGPCAVLNRGKEPITFGEWLGFSRTHFASRGDVIPARGAEGPKREEGLRAVAMALSKLVVSPLVNARARDLRPAWARHLFLQSFRCGPRGAWDYAAFQKATGIRLREKSARSAFRMLVARTQAKALTALAAATTGALEMLQGPAASSAQLGVSRDHAREERAKEDERQKEAKGTR